MLLSMEMNKLLGSLLGSTLSHPGKLLEDHLRNVSNVACSLAEMQGLDIDRALLSAVALTHDLAKIHPDFQKKLKGQNTGYNHAHPSALFTYSLTNDIWAAEVVSRHHTHLRNYDDMVAGWIVEDLNQPAKTLTQLIPNWPQALTREEYQILHDYLYLFAEIELNIERWMQVRTLYSLLVTGDRMEAIGISNIQEKGIASFTPPVFKKGNPIVDTWREDIKNVCIDNAKKVLGPGVYTLTLPTGAGKTAIGLQIAHDWARKFGSKTIIYALPFISIVEQTTARAREVFGADYVQEDHSLAKGGKDEGDGENAIWKKMTVLFRYWREPVVITTLVHFWDAIFNPHANHSMNFHRLSNSVVILDEPQSIPSHYWPGFGKVMEFLSNKWGTVFILMTATQPNIGRGTEIGPSNLFFPVNRHKYQILIKDKQPLANLPNILKANININQSGLVVMNRKRSALEAYNLVAELGLEGKKLLLSRWQTPRLRRAILRYLKYLEHKKTTRYLVATQVVEAGVDLDFNWVFRDLGPLDSIIQVAGRCNRHGAENFEGIVVIGDLCDDNGKSLCRGVYDELLIEISRDVLLEKDSLDEKDIPPLINKYYQRVLDALRKEPIFDNLANGKWGTFPPLIEESHFDVPVFVEEDSLLAGVIEQLENTVWTLKNRDIQKKLLERASQYLIEIPQKDIANCKKHCANLQFSEEEPPFREIFGGRAFFLGKEAINDVNGLYHPRLGYTPPTGEWDSFL